MSEQLKPELRFPEFDGENNVYSKTSFEDIFDFSTGKNIKQNEASPEFEIPCVRYGELYHMYNEVIDEVINYTNLDKSELRFSEGNEILLPSAGEDPLDIGSASALILPNVAIGRTINVLKPKESDTISSIYASYYINQVLKRKISTFAKGFSISNVYNSDLKRLNINLPIFPEQQKIANFLKAIDKRIKLLKAKKDALEDYKTSIMQKLFAQEIRFKQENGSDFPEWENRKLGEIGEFKTSSVNKKIEEDEKIVYLVNYMNVYRHEEITNANRNLLMQVSAKESQIEGNNLEKGDILFTPSSETPTDIGHSVVIKENLENTLYSYHLLRFRPSIPLDSGFSHYFCNDKNVLKQISRFAAGSTRFTISLQSFAKVKVNIPALEEQRKIAAFLSSIDLRLEKIENLATDLSCFKKSMLQRLFI